MRSEGIKCLEPEHKADFSGLNFFWKSCENTAQLESKTSNWGESEVPVLHLTTDRHFSVQNKGFSDQGYEPKQRFLCHPQWKLVGHVLCLLVMMVWDM